MHVWQRVSPLLNMFMWRPHYWLLEVKLPSAKLFRVNLIYFKLILQATNGLAFWPPVQHVNRSIVQVYKCGHFRLTWERDPKILMVFKNQDHELLHWTDTQDGLTFHPTRMELIRLVRCIVLMTHEVRPLNMRKCGELPQTQLGTVYENYMNRHMPILGEHTILNEQEQPFHPPISLSLFSLVLCCVYLLRVYDSWLSFSMLYTLQAATLTR